MPVSYCSLNHLFFCNIIRTQINFFIKPSGFFALREITFFVEFAALRGLCRDQPKSESDLLKAFDTYRSRIQDAAARVYARVSKGTNVCVVHANDI